MSTISPKAENFYNSIKPQIQKELKTLVQAFTQLKDGSEVLGFKISTPNAGQNYIIVEVDEKDTAEIVLRKYLTEAKKQDLVLSLSFYDYTKFI